MISPRLFVCSGARIDAGSTVAKGRQRIDLDSIGLNSNVNIRFENVTKALHQHLPARLVDLLEIASYVFTADCATERGEEWTNDDSKEAWGRDFAFVIPVRDPAFWKAPVITSLVKEGLGFLSNDKYSFTFVPLTQDRTEQHYFEFAERKDWLFHAPKRVVMFSGGLDSLAGAVETMTHQHNVVSCASRITEPGSEPSDNGEKTTGNEQFALALKLNGTAPHVPLPDAE